MKCNSPGLLKYFEKFAKEKSDRLIDQACPRIGCCSLANSSALAPGVHSAFSLMKVLKLKPPVMLFFFVEAPF